MVTPDEPNTKDTTHLHRKSTKAGRFVNITPHMKFNMKKDVFLSVLKNKNLFNQMLKDYINTRSSGIQAIQDNADADYLIAQTAITRSKDNQVVVISADTNMLVMIQQETKYFDFGISYCCQITAKGLGHRTD